MVVTHCQCYIIIVKNVKCLKCAGMVVSCPLRAPHKGIALTRYTLPDFIDCTCMCSHQLNNSGVCLSVYITHCSALTALHDFLPI
jgi:hypothetical protein